MSPAPKFAGKDNRYCLPIIRSKRSEVLALVKEHAHHFRYIEVWLDHIKDLEPGFATNLVGNHPNKFVFVFRRQKQEALQMDPDLRWKIIQSLSKKQVFVDLDVSLQTDEIQAVHAERLSLKLILSYHNYSFTPSDTQLRTTVSQMQSWKAHICKIATYCKNQRDSLRLMELLIDLREAGQKTIVLGMGPHGTITRIFGTMWGNEMTFAPLTDDERSAPGQLTRDRLETILETLQG
jgi:3-dehydroquinate dehydratase I